MAQLTAVAQARIREYLEERVSGPAISVEPRGGGLVNLPVVVHTDPSPPVGFEVTVPVPGRLAAEPAYRWSFGQGRSASGPGRPYTAAVSPRSDPGYYVAHAYREPGRHTITLTNTWTATFTVAGIVVPLDPIVLTDTTEVLVREARSTLVAADR